MCMLFYLDLHLNDAVVMSHCVQFFHWGIDTAVHFYLVGMVPYLFSIEILYVLIVHRIL